MSSNGHKPVSTDCPNCGCKGAVDFTVTYTDETHTVEESSGYECWECGAKLEHETYEIEEHNVGAETDLSY